MLSLQVCAVVARLGQDQPPCTVLYVEGRPADPDEDKRWLPLLAARADQQGLCRTEEDTPLGSLQVARFPLGFYGGEGEVTVASHRAGFPTTTELVLLRSAATLAASGLRAARLVQERERALRAKDEFLAMLGHELRNPLAPIVTALELIRIREGGASSPEHVVIDRHVGHLRRLVDDLLDVTRITTGKADLQRELIDLHSVAEAAVEAAQPLARERLHRLDWDVPPRTLWVHGDPLRLTQVIGNLLINATKYTEPGGRVTLSGWLDRDDVVVQVRDTGVGIEPGLLPHVFDLFQQGQVSADRSRGGLGIGLSIVRSLVTMHGGSVAADSAGPGCGSTFTIRLPQASAAVIAEPPKGTPAPADRGGDEDILLVDDNHDAADTLGQLLRAFGYRVRIFYHPVDALAACDAWRPSVAILDIGLPAMDGYELATRIRARFPDTPPTIVAVTGYGQAEDLQRSAEAGIDVHLTKPVCADTLMERLRQALPHSA